MDTSVPGDRLFTGGRVDLEAYLQRIGDRGGREPTLETLTRLHRAHMLAVPFENLDIPLGRPIVLSLPLLFDKVVRQGRGGFCYELNALFGWCLRELGFHVEMLEGRVFDGGQVGPAFDHMLLRVNEDFLADVGFGDSFLEPITLGPAEQVQDGRSYRLVENDERWILQQRLPGADWQPQYSFSLVPHALPEFEPMCRHQQTSPDSVFTRKSVCSVATAGGRVTLSNRRLIVTEGGERRERPISDAAECVALLWEHFRVDLRDEPHPERLLVQGR